MTLWGRSWRVTVHVISWEDASSLAAFPSWNTLPHRCQHVLNSSKSWGIKGTKSLRRLTTMPWQSSRKRSFQNAGEHCCFVSSLKPWVTGPPPGVLKGFNNRGAHTIECKLCAHLNFSSLWRKSTWSKWGSTLHLLIIGNPPEGGQDRILFHGQDALDLCAPLIPNHNSTHHHWCVFCLDLNVTCFCLSLTCFHFFQAFTRRLLFLWANPNWCRDRHHQCFMEVWWDPWEPMLYPGLCNAYA